MRCAVAALTAVTAVVAVCLVVATTVSASTLTRPASVADPTASESASSPAKSHPNRLGTLSSEGNGDAVSETLSNHHSNNSSNNNNGINNNCNSNSNSSSKDNKDNHNDDDDESRLEVVPPPVPLRARSLVRTLGRETAHKPSSHDVLLRDQAHEQARRHLAAMTANATSDYDDEEDDFGGNDAVENNQTSASSSSSVLLSTGSAKNAVHATRPSVVQSMPTHDLGENNVKSGAPQQQQQRLSVVIKSDQPNTKLNVHSVLESDDGLIPTTTHQVRPSESNGDSSHSERTVSEDDVQLGPDAPAPIRNVGNTESDIGPSESEAIPVMYSLGDHGLAAAAAAAADRLDTAESVNNDKAIDAAESGVIAPVETKATNSTIKLGENGDDDDDGDSSSSGSGGSGILSPKQPAPIFPSRYSTPVVIEANFGESGTTTEGASKNSTDQNSPSERKTSLGSTNDIVRGATREFGAIPHVLPYSDGPLPTPYSNEIKTYSGYKVYRVRIESSRHEGLLHSLAADEDNKVSLWDYPRVDHNVTIVVPPETTDAVETALAAQGLSYNVLSANLKEWIDAENKDLNPSLFLKQGDVHNFKLDRYHNLDEINLYLDLLVREYPSLVRPVTLGTTYENNTIRGLVVSSGGKKRAIYIDAGTHAREWISVAAALHMLTRFVTEANTDPTVKGLLDRYDFHFVPVINPDGYKYTWNGDRLWRKNRVRFQGFYWCAGVDPNRNFGYYWGTEGASANPCAQDYRGASEFSEAESRAVRDYITPIKDDLALYLSLHAYGLYLLSPYGSGPSLVSDQSKSHEDVGSAFQNAIFRKSGLTYRVGSSKGLLYPASGLSSDWVHSQGVTHAYVAELRDSGDYGFLLPAKQIVPTSEELFEGVAAMADRIAFIESQRP